MKSRLPKMRLVKSRHADTTARHEDRRHIHRLFEDAQVFLPTHVIDEVKRTILSEDRKYRFDEQDLEDIILTCLLKAWQKLGNFEHPPGYFGRIVKNTVVNFFRRQARTLAADSFDDRDLSLLERAAMTEALNCCFSKTELIDLIIKTLDAEEASVVFFRLYECYTYKQISMQLDIAVSTVKRRYGKALEALRANLVVVQSTESQKIGSLRESLENPCKSKY